MKCSGCLSHGAGGGGGGGSTLMYGLFRYSEHGEFLFKVENEMKKHRSIFKWILN